MKTRWTYKVECVRLPAFGRNPARAEAIADVLNRAGLDGWELCQIVDSVRFAVLWLCFKKPQ